MGETAIGRTCLSRRGLSVKFAARETNTAVSESAMASRDASWDGSAVVLKDREILRTLRSLQDCASISAIASSTSPGETACRTLRWRRGHQTCSDDKQTNKQKTHNARCLDFKSLNSTEPWLKVERESSRRLPLPLPLRNARQPPI